MAEDKVIDTSAPINDGGNVLSDEDVGNYIRVLIDQRNDAIDSVAVLRTKNMRFVAKAQELMETVTAVSELATQREKQNQELLARVATLESQLNSTSYNDLTSDGPVMNNSPIIDHLPS
jgi:hypothetical protein